MCCTFGAAQNIKQQQKMCLLPLSCGSWDPSIVCTFHLVAMVTQAQYRWNYVHYIYVQCQHLVPMQKIVFLFCSEAESNGWGAYPTFMHVYLGSIHFLVSLKSCVFSIFPLIPLFSLLLYSSCMFFLWHANTRIWPRWVYSSRLTGLIWKNYYFWVYTSK